MDQSITSTLDHLDALAARIEKLSALRLGAQAQLFQATRREYVAGRMSDSDLATLIRSYRPIAPPGWGREFQEVVGVNPNPFIAHMSHRERNVPNGEDGAGMSRWHGDYPFRRGAPRPIKGTCVVYVLFLGPHAVYVGSSQQFHLRLQRHSRDKEFDNWIAYPYPDRKSAYSAESEFIVAYKPRLNKAGGAK